MSSNSRSNDAAFRSVILFFVLSYVISWGAALVLHVIARQAGLAHFGSLMRMAESTFDLGSVADRLILPVPVVFVLTRIVDFGPTLAGLVTASVVGGVAGFKRLGGQLLRWRVGVRWYLLAVFGPGLAMLIAIGLYALVDSSFLASANFIWPTIGRELLFWLFVRTMLGGGLGEELGWRGFALPRLAAHYGPNRASLVIGIVWTFWHLPGHLIGASPVANLLAQLLVTIPGSYVATWLYLRTGGSVLILTLFHGALNGFNSFYERSLFPALRDADAWLLIFIALLIGISIWASTTMRGEWARFSERTQGYGSSTF
ncbi:MAG: CPBP family intramembrane glutamic endopeptidase [Gemmatimonadota bacterium]